MPAQSLGWAPNPDVPYMNMFDTAMGRWSQSLRGKQEQEQRIFEQLMKVLTDPRAPSTAKQQVVEGIRSNPTTSNIFSQRGVTGEALESYATESPGMTPYEEATVSISGTRAGTLAETSAREEEKFAFEKEKWGEGAPGREARIGHLEALTESLSKPTSDKPTGVVATAKYLENWLAQNRPDLSQEERIQIVQRVLTKTREPGEAGLMDMSRAFDLLEDVLGTTSTITSQRPGATPFTWETGGVGGLAPEEREHWEGRQREFMKSLDAALDRLVPKKKAMKKLEPAPTTDTAMGEVPPIEVLEVLPLESLLEVIRRFDTALAEHAEQQISAGADPERVREILLMQLGE